MRPTILAQGQWTTEPENGRRKSVSGSVRGSIVHRDFMCFVVSAGIAMAWIEGSDPAPRDVHMRLVQGAWRDLTISMAISPDGKTMASCDPHGLVMLRDMTDWQSVHTYTHSKKGRSAWSLAFSPDSQYLAVGGNESGIVLLDLQAGCKELRLSSPISKVRSLAFSPRGGLLAATSSEEGKTVLCDPVLGKTLRVLSTTSVSLSVAFSPDGRILATGGRDGRICLWDVATGGAKFRLDGEFGPVLSVAFSPAGTLLASTSTGSPQVELWEVSTGRQVKIIKGNGQATNAVAFSPDGKTLASGGNDGMLRLWNVSTGHQRMYLDGRSVALRNVMFSPDGRTLLATANDKDIRLWEVAELADELSDAGGSGRQPDGPSSNKPPRFANSHSGSEPRPVYSMDGPRARSIEPNVCLDG
jgi:WD40 repeat protein